MGREIADLATSPLIQEASGRLIHEGKVISSPFEDDIELQERFFHECEELAGVHFADAP